MAASAVGEEGLEVGTSVSLRVGCGVGSGGGLQLTSSETTIIATCRRRETRNENH